MKKIIGEDKIPDNFTEPTALPRDSEQAARWQEANYAWWEKHPMRYDWKQGIRYEEFSEEFFAEIDRRFLLDLKDYLPWEKIPFDYLVNYELLKNMDVLEIGVGNGTCASLLARHARSFTGIDITGYAVKSTSERMRQHGLNAKIIRMDAECMEFADNSFDFIWSWGVIHHTSDTKRVLNEIKRILKPGGIAVTMVYHRGFWNYYVAQSLFNGIFRGGFFKTRSLHKIVQMFTDGAIARYYSIDEWVSCVSEFFSVENIMVCGSKSEIIPLPGGKLKNFVSMLIPGALSRFLTNRCKMGSFLISTLKKKL